MNASRSTFHLVRAFVLLSRDTELADLDSRRNCSLTIDDFQASFNTLHNVEHQTEHSEVNKVVFCKLTYRLKRVGILPANTFLIGDFDMLFVLGSQSGSFWNGFRKSFTASRAARLVRLDT